MITLFIIITLFSIPTINEKNIIKTNVIIDTNEELTNSKLYLLNKDNYLVLVNVLLKEKDPVKKVLEVFNYLKEDNNLNNYKGYIPKDTKVLDCSIENNNLNLVLSEDITSISNNNLRGLINSLLMFKYYDTISIAVDSPRDYRFNTTYDRSYPLNIEYENINRNDNTKVVIYYLEDNNNFVPVTRYMNNNKEKIEIIIDELKNNIPRSLKSYFDNNLEIINYDIDNEYISINLNNKPSHDLILNEIAYAVFANYDVSTLIIKVNNKVEKILTNPIK